MIRKVLFFGTLLTVFVTGTAFIIISSTGMTGSTGSPSEGNCGGCHSGGSSIASGMTITASPSFTGNVYEPGQTYSINVTVGAVGFNNFGFGCEILNSSNGNAGTMQNPGPGVAIANGPFGRKNAIHTSIKSGSGFATFTFQWVAPSNGAVTIYAAGNCVNLNGSTNGDLPLVTSLALVPPVGTGIGEEEIQIGNVSIYPNPVKDKLNVNYNLSGSDNVSIQLVSIKGELIAELLNEKKSSGLHHEMLQLPSSVSTGVYFLKLSNNAGVVKQKLITVY